MCALVWRAPIIRSLRSQWFVWKPFTLCMLHGTGEAVDVREGRAATRKESIVSMKRTVSCL